MGKAVSSRLDASENIPKSQPMTSTSTKRGLGQTYSGWLSHAGPETHIAQRINSDGDKPLDGKSAGLDAPGTWCHILGGQFSLISSTRRCINTALTFDVLHNQKSTFLLSHQRCMVSKRLWGTVDFFTAPINRDKVRAPKSSKRDTELLGL